VNVRFGTIAFVAVCAAGSTAAVGLTVREVVRTPPVVVSVLHTTRVANTTTVDVSVHNTTRQARCARVRVAARDREGHDLATALAANPLVLAPHERGQVSVAVTLTRRQYAEKLYRFFPSVPSCGNRG
jgi:hypothetical protein